MVMIGFEGLRHLGLFLVGLLAGKSLETFVDLPSRLSYSLDIISPGLYAAVILSLLLLLWVLRKNWRSTEFVLISFALVCVLDEMFMAWTIAPPEKWMYVHFQWQRFMYIRSALLFAGFGMLLAASYLRIRLLLSRKMSLLSFRN